MTLKEYEEYLSDNTKNGMLSSLESRLFDTAYKAVNIQELDFVIENTGNLMVQDYALKKKIFWLAK